MNPEPSEADPAKMKALQQKRTMAFVNHCVRTNVHCLNNFMLVCEEKLIQFERKLDRVDAAMVLLESKLLTIPEVMGFSELKEDPALEPIDEYPQYDTNAPAAQSTEVTTDDTPQNTAESTITRPEYNRFVKMVQVGVPLQAAKLKCALEGLDPEVLAEILGK